MNFEKLTRWQERKHLEASALPTSALIETVLDLASSYYCLIEEYRCDSLDAVNSHSDIFFHNDVEFNKAMERWKHAIDSLTELQNHLKVT